MRVVMLVALLGMGVLSLPASSGVTAAETPLANFSVTQLMQATALDLTFEQFGASIAAAARDGDISRDATFLAHWQAAAESAFHVPALRSQLSSSLDGKFTDAERLELGAFYGTGLGRAITELERDVARLDAEDQAAALLEGFVLAQSATAARSSQLDDLMLLMGAEISGAMAGQQIRALLLGMAVSQQRSDIEVPWEEIDAQVEAMLPDLIADHAQAQRALMAYAYRDLGDDDLDRYIAFLRTEPAQHFYAVAAYSVGQIAARSMARFGQMLAMRLSSVAI
jgi:hypothetical protein